MLLLVKGVDRAEGADEVGHALVAADQRQLLLPAQLGHRSLKSTEQYAHLGKRAQLRIVADLEPSSPPHGTLTARER